MDCTWEITTQGGKITGTTSQTLIDGVSEASVVSYFPIAFKSTVLGVVGTSLDVGGARLQEIFVTDTTAYTDKFTGIMQCRAGNVSVSAYYMAVGL